MFKSKWVIVILRKNLKGYKKIFFPLFFTSLSFVVLGALGALVVQIAFVLKFFGSSK
jgi:hypothetical protein